MRGEQDFLLLLFVVLCGVLCARNDLLFCFYSVRMEKAV